MSRLVGSITLVLLIQSAFADQQAFPNAVTADPTHYTVEFENDVLRIVRVKYGPGEASVMHSHDASCGIYLANGAMRLELPDGTSRAVSAYGPGTVHCNDAEAHLPSNVGDTAMELVLIEMKGRKTAK
jgi:quercetin dioxygenase-like cupin family protein